MEKKRGFPGGNSGKESAANSGDTRDADWIPGSGRSPGAGNGNLVFWQPGIKMVFLLENPKDRGDCRAIVHGVAKSQT